MTSIILTIIAIISVISIIVYIFVKNSKRYILIPNVLMFSAILYEYINIDNYKLLTPMVNMIVINIVAIIGNRMYNIK